MTREDAVATWPRRQRRGIGGGPGAPFTVLFVCTGNVCRSAVAERLARAYLDEVLGGRAGDFRLCSAGTGAVVGSGVHPDSALVLRGLGGDPQGFRAQQLEQRLLAGADLVLVMTREHRDAVLQLAPAALHRTFLLLEAADLLEHLGPDVPVAGDVPAERARSLVAAMAAARGRRGRRAGEAVPDPIGRPVEVHQEVAEVIAAALLPVLARLTGQGRDDGTGSTDDSGERAG